jgi:nonsense-mediated mRNA decay protein 3
MQCPLCGREVGELPAGLCDRCASERKPFLDAPDVVDIMRCAHCGRVERAGGWKPAPEDETALVEEHLLTSVHVDPDLTDARLDRTVHWEDPRNAVADLRLTGTYRGEPVERTGQTRVRLKTTACHDCSREYGGYFEAIIQLRAASERTLDAEGEHVLVRIQRQLDAYRAQQRTGAYASKSERVRGGWDLYMGSQEVARLVARDAADAYGAEYAESSKLVGRRDGRDLLRFTLLVRLPPYLVGDFIFLDGRYYKVLAIDRKRLTLWDLEREETMQREPRRARQLKVIGTREEEREAVVVSARGADLQVLDPVTLRTVDLKVAPDFNAGQTVRVFRLEDRLFVLPDAR